MRNKYRPWLRLQQAKNKRELRDLFWSADLFVNPSIQPDENFGTTPREAMACGLPLVTTNFCGLRPLADNMPWGGVDTYPTIYGSRFSLRQLRGLLKKAIDQRNLLTGQECRNFVVKESNPKILKDNLRQAVEYLRKKPVQVARSIEDAELSTKQQLFKSVDGKIFKYFVDAQRELINGAYVYGDGPAHYAFPVVQGIYSAMSTPPKVEKNSICRGFFRIALWDKERAVVEFGYPGPRIRRYPKRLWNPLFRCSRCLKNDEYVIVPKSKEQAVMVQELVDLGYLVWG